MSDVASWSMDGSIAILTVDNPPVNAISLAVRSALMDGVRRATEDDAVDALVIICSGRTFFAGADISEFSKPPSEPFLTTVVDALELCPKPVVAAIHGNALGGGLEIAMSCHYRIATAGAKLGLPEVKLGIMPGAHGTQLLPRLVGVEQALETIALGNPVSASKAQEIGLVDKIAAGLDTLLAEAVSLARGSLDVEPRKTRKLDAAKVADGVYQDFASRNARKFRNLDAPPAIIASVKAATELPFEQGVRQEREAFLSLRDGPQSAALRYAFFAEREAAKIQRIKGVKPREVRSVGVIGSGTMGSGITIALLCAGIPVVLYERDLRPLENGVERILKTIEGNVRSGRMDEADGQIAANTLTPTNDMAELSDVDIVIEAAYETMDVKREIFSALDAIAKPGAILASNTSYLDLDKIAASTNRPADVVGLHFFSPANIMKLLEVVRCDQTAPEVIATAFALAKRIGKIAVLAANGWGFIGNRMLAARREQADRMVIEGASPEQVDTVLENFGFAMGPFRVSDLAGLDLGWTAETSSGSTIRERLCEAGRRGQKTGKGFYDYDDKRKPLISREAREIIASFAANNDVEQRQFSDAEILDRLLWPMVDEGAKIIEEGIALRESDIDVVWMNGYGWPSHTGGPMFHARRTGYAEVVRSLRRMAVEPSDALCRLAVD